MEVLKTIGLIILVMLLLSAGVIRYMLAHGMHVPTNDELISVTKATIEAKKNPKTEKGPVKASEIKKLKKTTT